MGWLGIGALAASAAFLLYHHPPSSWTSPPTQTPEPSSKPLEDDQVPGHDTEERIDLGEKQDDPISQETTPKATPATPSPQVNIPSFNLDSGPEPTEEPSGTIPSNTNIPQLATGPSDKSAGTLSPTPAVQTQVPSGRAPPRLNPLPQEKTAKGGNSGLMLPPARPPPRPSPSASLRPPPSSASSLRVPTTKTAPGSGLSPTPLQGRAQNTSKKVTLKPGHSPLDWAALTASQGSKLRGANLPPNLIRVTPSMLKAQNGRKGRDAWTSYQNKVYNITPYVPFHPGGEGELLRGAGKGSDKLFLEYHPWVNWEGMLGECMVGILVSEDDGQQDTSTELDSMD